MKALLWTCNKVAKLEINHWAASKLLHHYPNIQNADYKIWCFHLRNFFRLLTVWISYIFVSISVYRAVTQILKIIGLTKIRYQSDTFTLDWYLIDVNLKVFAVWVVQWAQFLPYRPGKALFMGNVDHFHRLVPERCNSIANAMELHLSCTKSLIWWLHGLLGEMVSMLPGYLMEITGHHMDVFAWYR